MKRIVMMLSALCALTGNSSAADDLARNVAVPASHYKPQAVEVSLAAQRLGSVLQAALAGSDKPLALSEKDGRINFAVQPNPVATVALKGAKP